ncbi:MAG: hypothetical protein IKR05_11910, partial [Prevotella sp.]|nr:hypothetical protein [Prevotella sp.]MBR6263904.1 hypothetical protein [Prevotella sp.]
RIFPPSRLAFDNTPQGAAKAARLLLVLLLCLSYVILSKNDCRVAFSSKANAKVRLNFKPSKFATKILLILMFLKIH